MDWNRMRRARSCSGMASRPERKIEDGVRMWKVEMSPRMLCSGSVHAHSECEWQAARECVAPPSGVDAHTASSSSLPIQVTVSERPHDGL